MYIGGLTMKFINFFLIAVGIAFQSNALAENAAPGIDGADLVAATDPQASDKINVDNLEKKYWSSKDDNFTVVQNRTFTKIDKYFLSLQTGKLINDGFSEGTPSGVSMGYFWNERWGIEYDYQKFAAKDNQVTNGFNQNFGVYPNFNRTMATHSLGVVFVPVYAKVSLFEQKILYLDLALGLNVGAADYVIETDKGQIAKSAPLFGVDVTQHWFLSKNFALRFDIRNKWSSQEQLKYQISSNASEDSRPLGRTQILDTTWQFGFTYFH
jgi:outer membrane beta-barrel protein